MEQHIYTSAKDNFLSFHQWVNLNATEDEKLAYNSEESTETKRDLYNRWIISEQILSHKGILEDGTEILYPTPADAIT